MFARRMLYLATLIGVVAFHLFYTEFDSYLLLVSLLALPVISLAVSLPAMLRTRITLAAPATVQRGRKAELTVQLTSGGRGAMPVGGARFRLVSHNRFTGAEPYPARVYLAAGNAQTIKIPIDTAHCGCILHAAAHVRVLDHLGLIALPVRRCAGTATTVLPAPTPPDPIPKLFDYAAYDLRPKPGGGFSEEHELRQYREGDAITSVHWKLSSKLDALIVREPMEPRIRPVLLTFELSGTPQALDAMLSELTWLSNRLSAHGLAHLLEWRDGTGKLHTERVTDEKTFETLLRRLLARPAAAHALPPASVAPKAGAYYHVGGKRAAGEVRA